MKGKVIAVGFVVAGLLAGCATSETYQPMVDHKDGVDSAKYQQDLRECRAYARQVNPQGEAVAGAIIGALVTAATVALAVDSGDYLGRSAGVGALAGAAQGGAGAAQTQRSIIARCLQGRGYSVLN